MEDYSIVKLKRKDLEEFSNDFSEFSLFSPARKIRRLDAQIPPIVKEEESEMPFVFEEITPDYNSTEGLSIEELPNEPSNEERAIVLYSPNNILSSSPPSFSFSLQPQILSRFKNHVLLPSKPNHLIGTDDEEQGTDASGSETNCLAVVPWSQPPVRVEVTNSDQEFGEMEAMEVEENNQSNGMMLIDSFHQWQQQHCFVPHPPLNANAPVNWYQ